MAREELFSLDIGTIHESSSYSPNQEQFPSATLSGLSNLRWLNAGLLPHPVVNSNPQHNAWHHICAPQALLDSLTSP